MAKIVLRNRLSDIEVEKVKLGDGMIQHHKIVLGPYGEVIIKDGELQDIDKFIQSNEENAGAFNYIRKEMSNGKTLEQIINEGNIGLQNALYADVSNITEDMTAAEVEDRIQTGVAEVLKVAQTLGLTPEEFLKLDAAGLKQAISKAAAEQESKAAQEGKE